MIVKMKAYTIKEIRSLKYSLECHKSVNRPAGWCSFNGFSTSSRNALHAAKLMPMAATVPRCAQIARKVVNRKGGYRRPRANTKGVARAHGSQDSTSVTDSR